jgi:putative transposase
MQKAHQWEMADDAAWNKALQREAVIRPLAEYLRLSVDDITTAASQLGLSRAVLYKLLQRYRRRP